MLHEGSTKHTCITAKLLDSMSLTGNKLINLFFFPLLILDLGQRDNSLGRDELGGHKDIPKLAEKCNLSRITWDLLPDGPKHLSRETHLRHIANQMLKQLEPAPHNVEECTLSSSWITKLLTLSLRLSTKISQIN